MFSPIRYASRRRYGCSQSSQEEAIGQWSGMLLAPNGEIELEGDNLFSPSTLIFAGEELEIEGDNIDLTAADLGRWSEVALVE